MSSSETSPPDDGQPVHCNPHGETLNPSCLEIHFHTKIPECNRSEGTPSYQISRFPFIHKMGNACLLFYKGNLRNYTIQHFDLFRKIFP